MGDKKIKSDKTIRVDKEFKNQIDGIKEERGKRLIDTKKTNSSRKITSMIPKHKFWKRMKEDIINFDFDK